MTNLTVVECELLSRINDATLRVNRALTAARNLNIPKICSYQDLLNLPTMVLNLIENLEAARVELKEFIAERDDDDFIHLELHDQFLDVLKMAKNNTPEEQLDSSVVYNKETGQLNEWYLRKFFDS